MGSTEKSISGRIFGGRSNFSQKCSLLSQYLKENGGFGEISLGLTSGAAAETKGTLNLLPMIEKSSQNSAATSADADEDSTSAEGDTATGPMTIFYAGQVIVFDNYRADKANEIMKLASKFSAAAGNHQSTAESAAAFVVSEHPRHHPYPSLVSDLPIARKNSLARFLEKRKNRLSATAPYQASSPAPTLKPVKAEPWLGLASHFPLY